MLASPSRVVAPRSRAMRRPVSGDRVGPVGNGLLRIASACAERPWRPITPKPRSISSGSMRSSRMLRGRRRGSDRRLDRRPRRRGGACHRYDGARRVARHGADRACPAHRARGDRDLRHARRLCRSSSASMTKSGRSARSSKRSAAPTRTSARSPTPSSIRAPRRWRCRSRADANFRIVAA